MGSTKQSKFEFLKSKKFIIGCTGILCLTAAFIFGGLGTTEYTAGMSGIIGSFMIGQGIADNGKEAAKVESEQD